MDTVYDVFDIFLGLPDSVSNHFDCMAENSLLTLFTTSLFKVIQVITVSHCLLLSDISLCHLLDFTPKEIAKTRKLSNLVKLLISKLWSFCTFTCSWDYYSLILMFLWHFSKSLEINITLNRLKKPGWAMLSAICASAWCIKSRRCVYSRFVLYANQCSSWFVVRVVSPESRRLWLTFISWQNAPAFLFIVSFAICSNITAVCSKEIKFDKGKIWQEILIIMLTSNQ